MAEKQKIRKPKKHTVKKDETYGSIADQYGFDEKGVMQSAGIDNLKPGQIINLPQAGPLDQFHGTPKPPPQVPDLPGYGGTVADYQAAGATVTGPADPFTRQSQYAQFQQKEQQSAQDFAAIQAAERLAPGARGPKAQAILAAAGEARERLYGPATSGVTDYFSKAFTQQDEYLAGYTYEEWNKLPPELRTAIQNQAANPIEGFNYWWGGGEEGKYNPETGEWESIGPAPQTWGDIERQQQQQRMLELNRQYYHEQLPDLAPEEVETIAQNIQPQYGEPFDTNQYRKFTQDDKPDWVPPGTDTFVHEGMVYYGKDGIIIPMEEFSDYLAAHKKTYKNMDDYMASPEGQKQVFLLTAKWNFRAVQEAMLNDDRSMLPPVITQAELDVLGQPDRDWNDFMTNVLGYRWDAQKGAWIKQEVDESIPFLGAGGYGSGGGYGGYGGGGGDWKASSGQYLRPEAANRGRSDRRYAQSEGGISPTHWRI